MKIFRQLVLTLLGTLSLGATYAQGDDQFDPVELVNTLVGSQSTQEFSTGNTYPAIATPWGMNFWTPQTGEMGNGWTYGYHDKKIRGFKQTHQPSPWINDYGQFSLMPTTGKILFDEHQRESWFSHKAEVAKPYYYKVYLADHDVITEITPSDRGSVFRVTFPRSDSSSMVIDAFDKGSFIKILPEQRMVIGYTTKNSGGVPANFKNYFVLKFDRDFDYVYSFADGKLSSHREQQADHVGGVVGFRTRAADVVQVHVASSFISPAQALINLQEVENKSFEQVKIAAKRSWNDVLGKIKVEGGTTDQLRTFYSCLYRSTLFPRKFYEIDAQGNAYHYSPYNGKVLPGYMYTDTGFWDTFRSLFPLLNMLYPSVNRQIQEGLVNTYKESGFYPEWASPGHRDCMVGNNSASVLADAYLKGIRVEDLTAMYQGLVHGANDEHKSIKSTGRWGFAYYNKLGYVPYDVGIRENVARTLEYAYDDWCIYKVAKELKRPQAEIDRYAQRAMNYKHVFDPKTCLMRGKNKDGNFMSPFSPLKWGDAFTEGNAWHYTWSVFHDPQGLIDLMGGRQPFINMLDSVFRVPPIFDESYYGAVIHEIREMQVMNMGNYAHGNQPIQHMIYMYNYAGAPWKAQYWLREVMNRMYAPTPDGYCGDEDNGQTSAWYVFSALGFYPVCPGSNQYVLGAPLFKRATICFENGRKTIINAPNNAPASCYIESMKVNGMGYTKNYISHDELTGGVTIDCKMSERENRLRGTKSSDLPYSFSNEK